MGHKISGNGLTHKGFKMPKNWFRAFFGPFSTLQTPVGRHEHARNYSFCECVTVRVKIRCTSLFVLILKIVPFRWNRSDPKWPKNRYLTTIYAHVTVTWLPCMCKLMTSDYHISATTAQYTGHVTYSMPITAQYTGNVTYSSTPCQSQHSIQDLCTTWPVLQVTWYTSQVVPAIESGRGGRVGAGEFPTKYMNANPRTQ